MPIKLGVINWQSFAADGSYYPDDLPLDWKLSYYANEFSSACLDLATLDMEFASLQQQVEGLSDGFDLSLAFSGLSQLDQWYKPLQQLSIKLHSIILPPPALARLLQDEARSGWLFSGGVVDQSQWLTLDQLWTPDNPSPQSRIALLPGQGNMKQYREWIQRWAGDRPERCENLWLPGEIVTVSQLSKIRTLLELLGY